MFSRIKNWLKGHDVTTCSCHDMHGLPINLKTPPVPKIKPAREYHMRGAPFNPDIERPEPPPSPPRIIK